MQQNKEDEKEDAAEGKEQLPPQLLEESLAVVII